MNYSAVIHWDVNPEIFTWGIFSPLWYSTAFLVGFIIGYYIMYRIYQQDKVSTETLDNLLLFLILGTVIGARLGHCLFYEWDYYKTHLLEIVLPVQFEPTFQFTGYQGLASHGGAIGVLIAQWWYCKSILKKPLLWLLDRIGVPIMLVGGLIRLGNLMNSEIIGIPTDVPWAFVFERVDTIPRHPVQLYEAIAYFIIFGILLYLYWRTDFKKQTGKLLGIFTVLLWTTRFFIEYFKDEMGGIESSLGLFSTGQWLSIPLIIVGGYFWWKANSIQV